MTAWVIYAFNYFITCSSTFKNLHLIVNSLRLDKLLQRSLVYVMAPRYFEDAFQCPGFQKKMLVRSIIGYMKGTELDQKSVSGYKFPWLVIIFFLKKSFRAQNFYWHQNIMMYLNVMYSQWVTNRDSTLLMERVKLKLNDKLLSVFPCLFLYSKVDYVLTCLVLLKSEFDRNNRSDIKAM